MVVLDNLNHLEKKSSVETYKNFQLKYMEFSPPNNISKLEGYDFGQFLAHLNWRFKWVFLITLCQSSFPPSLGFSSTTGPKLTKVVKKRPDGKDILNC